MVLPNYHVHTIFSDGKEDPEAFIKHAISIEMPEIGFSDHSPVPFPSYWNMKEKDFNKYQQRISLLKHKYINDIVIKIGMEVDYISDLVDYSRYKNLDYIIGSIHYFKDNVDNFDENIKNFTTLLKNLFDGDIKKMISEYYRLESEMVRVLKPEIIGHLDLIKKFNKGNYFFNEREKWYQSLVEKTLIDIKRGNSIVEINTKGVYTNIDHDFYPSQWILSRCKELEVPVIISADAHSPRSLGLLFPEVETEINKLGLPHINNLTTKEVF